MVVGVVEGGGAAAAAVVLVDDDDLRGAVGAVVRMRCCGRQAGAQLRLALLVERDVDLAVGHVGLLVLLLRLVVVVDGVVVVVVIALAVPDAVLVLRQVDRRVLAWSTK